jgi:hypothetical protein
MARTGDEVNSQSFNIVVGIVEAMNFQLAAIAGAGIEMTNSQCSTHMMQNLFIDLLYLVAQGIVGLRRSLGFNSGAENLLDDMEHNYKSTPL